MTVINLLQLRGYIQEQSIYARIDELQGATAVNRVVFDNTIRSYGDDTQNLAASLSVAYPFILLISVLIIAVIIGLLMCVQCTRICKHKSKTTEGKQYKKLSYKYKAAIISIAIIVAIRLIMMLALDAAAIYYTFKPSTVDIKEIHNSDDEVLYYAPFGLLTVDLLSAITYVVIVCTASACKTRSCGAGSKSNTAFSDIRYYIIALTLFCFLATALVHLPYVAIAYINDPNYAGSVFIFFTIATFLEFIILELIFISWFKFNTEVTPSDEVHRKYCSTTFTFTIIAMILSLSLLYLMLSVSVCFFFYLPIKHSISNPPNQIIIIYQTGLIFAGALVTYKTIFKRQSNPLIRALKNSAVKNSLPNEIELEAISDRKKLANFYSFIITDIVLKLPRVEGQLIKGQPNATEIPVSPPL